MWIRATNDDRPDGQATANATAAANNNAGPGLSSTWIFHWSTAADDGDCTVQCTDCVWRVDAVNRDGASKQIWPPGVYTNCKLVWLSPTPYNGKPLPAGVTISTNAADWWNAVGAWRERNPDLAARWDALPTLPTLPWTVSPNVGFSGWPNITTTDGLQVVGALQLGAGYASNLGGIDSEYAYVFLNNRGNRPPAQLYNPKGGGTIRMARVRIEGGAGATVRAVGGPPGWSRLPPLPFGFGLWEAGAYGPGDFAGMENFIGGPVDFDQGLCQR